MVKEPLARVKGLELPQWADFPDIDLYMDQVLGLMARYLETWPGFDQKGLTASMVNNYVKLGVIPPPVKKKYSRTHLACLVILCVLKPVLPISAVHQLIARELEQEAFPAFYDRFRTWFSNTTQSAATAIEEIKEDLPTAIYYAALRAQAEQTLAMMLLEQLFPPAEPTREEPKTKKGK